MSTIFLRSVDDGIEFDTQAKKMRLLEMISSLSNDCASEHDRSMLLMAFDILSSIEFRTYE